MSPPGSAGPADRSESRPTGRSRFRRAIGLWAGIPTDPQGRPIPEETWRARRDEWLPSAADRDFVKALMRPVTAPGKMAGWIAPPEHGINGLPADYEYVRL